MFSLASGIYQSYFAPPKLSILIIGLDGSGKTSLLERIKVTNINTRLVVTTNKSTAPSSSSIISPTLYYGKDCAVAGIIESSTGDDNNSSNNTKRQQQGGKPARLPPPLPPKLAMKSHQMVEQMLEDGFSSTSTAATTTKREELINSVPFPPLTNHPPSDNNNNEVSSQTKEKKNDRNKPSPLPPRHDSISSSGSTTTTPIKKSTKQASISPAAAIKKNSFIELLRCPSPKKYSDAAIVDDDEDDEYQDLVDTTTTIPNNSNNNGNTTITPWSIEYLQDYYINYQPQQEFDNTIKAGSRGRNQKGMKKMFPIDKIRPTLGQNLAKLDLCGCKCSLFDLSGAEKMRPLWERYYRDTDAIIYVVNAAETSISKLHQSRRNFEQMCNNDALQRRVRCGLPILIFANQLDVAYMEYEDSMNKANNNNNGQRGISWNADEEDDFVGGTTNSKLPDAKTSNDDNDNDEESSISKRVVDFHDLATLFGFPQHSISSICDEVGGQSIPVAHQGNIFLFGGSAKTGEGVRASMEFLTMAAKNYHIGIEARK